MFLYNPIGKTLAEIHKDCGANFSGYSVFVLQDESDKVGECLGDSISIRLILLMHPEYADYIVKYKNDFFGMTVLRVVKDTQARFQKRQ